MTANFPTTLDSFVTNKVSGDVIPSAQWNDMADAINKVERMLGLGGSTQVFDLVYKYGVSTAASASANTTAIQQAFTDAAAAATLGPVIVYLRGTGQPYPVNTLTLPSAPICFMGDGPMDSVLATTSGTILTYSNTTPALRGTSDPWSKSSTALGGTNAAVHYRSKFWRITNIGFTKSDNWAGNSGTGLDFPNWDMTGWGSLSPSANTSDALLLWMDNVYVTNFNGTGISYLINGLRGESKFFNIMSDGNAHEGVIFGSDQVWTDCSSNNNGYEGWWVDSRNGQLIGPKAYSNGTLNGTSRNAGFHVQGQSGGTLISAAYAQDNHGPGLEISGASRIAINGFVSDRNCWNNNTTDSTKQAGVTIADSTDISITGLEGTDSFVGTKNNPQSHMLKVTNTGGNTNARNRVELMQSSYPSGQTLSTPVDTASDLSGTRVTVGASDGGEYVVAYAATVTPDPYQAQTWVIGALTSTITIAAPSNGHRGCRLRIRLLQDGTGGRTVTWNAAFKQAFVTTGNTASKMTIVEFEYDGTNWVQVGSNLWV